MWHSRQGRLFVAASVAIALLIGATVVFVCAVSAQQTQQTQPTQQAQDQQTQQPQQTPDQQQQPKLAQLMDQLSQKGLKTRKLDNTTWIVPFQGDNDLTINVFVTYNNDKRTFALLFATVVDKPDKYDYNRDILLECMKLNNDYPGVKFCLDYDNGDIDCQSEILMSTITADSLETHLNLVAALANSSYTKLNNLAP